MNYSTNFRQNLLDYWQQWYPKWEIPKGYHVHHIKPKCTFEDQNDPKIHHPSNLIALHPDDHVAIHRCRGDKWANESFLKVLGNKTSGMKGKHHSEESKNKMRKKLRGKKLPLDQAEKRKGKGNPFYGRTHSKETKLKMSKSSKGIGHPCNEETKKKISLSKTGVKRPPMSSEQKAKISAAMKGKGKGRKLSEEHKANISKAKKLAKTNNNIV